MGSTFDLSYDESRERQVAEGIDGDQGRQRRGARTAVAAGIVVACGAFGAVGAAGAAQQAAEIAIGTSASEFVPDVQQIDTGDTVVWQTERRVPQRQGRHRACGGLDLGRLHTTPKNSGRGAPHVRRPGHLHVPLRGPPGHDDGHARGRRGDRSRRRRPTPTTTPTATPPPAATSTPAPTTTVPDDHTTTPAPGGGAADTTAPALSRVALKGRRQRCGSASGSRRRRR